MNDQRNQRIKDVIIFTQDLLMLYANEYTIDESMNDRIKHVKLDA